MYHNFQKSTQNIIFPLYCTISIVSSSRMTDDALTPPVHQFIAINDGWRNKFWVQFTTLAVAKPVAQSWSRRILRPSIWYQKDWIYTADSDGGENEIQKKRKGKGKGKGKQKWSNLSINLPFDTCCVHVSVRMHKNYSTYAAVREKLNWPIKKWRFWWQFSGPYDGWRTWILVQFSHAHDGWLNWRSK